MIKRLLMVIVALFTTTIYSQNDSIKTLDEVTVTASRFKLEAASLAFRFDRSNILRYILL